MRVTTLYVLLTLATITGCETYYRKPDSSPTARVRFAGTASNHHILVTQYEQESTCDFGRSGGILGVVGGVNRDPLGSVPAHIKEAGNTLQMMGYTESSGIRPIERVVAADRPFVFTISRLVDIKLEGTSTRS